MRRSHLLVVGLGVAAAAVTGSAFTAANPMPAGTAVTGYGEVSVTGATVSDISYTPSTDNTTLAAVVFTLTTEVTDETVTLTLKDGGVQVGASPYSCTATTPWAAGSMVFTCATADFPFTDFDAVGLTVRD
jgi:hypothetical protein